MTRALRFMALLAAMVAAGSCGSGPTSGEIDVLLEAPRQDLKAIRFRMVSADQATIDSVSAACAGCQVFLFRVSPTEVRGVMTGNITPGIILRLLVPDMALAPVYVGSVQDAALADYSLVPVSGFRLTVQAPR